MSALPGKRGLRWLLLVSASLSAIAVFLLATATANTALFAQGYDTLLILNGVLIALLMLVVGWQLWRLRRNLKAGIFGSRLAVRLVFLFALVAVLPGALVYAVSVQFIGRSIESWFDVRVDRALEGGLNLGRNALDYLLTETTNKATQMAQALADSPGNLSGALNRAAEQGNVYEAALFSPDRERARRRRRRRLARPRRSLRPPTALRLARLQQPYSKIEQGPDGGLGAACRRAREHAGQPQSAEAAAGHRAGAQGARAGCRTRAGGGARLPGALVLAQRVEAPLCADAHADAAPRAHVGAGPRRRAVRALRRAARPARRRHARGRAGRLHAPAARRVPRRAGRADRIVQHDDGAAGRSAGQGRGQPARDRDDARVPREHPRQPVGRRARVRRAAPAAHRQSERRGDPAAAARGTDRHAARRLGQAAARARAVRRARRPRAFAAAAKASGSGKRTSTSPTCRARC